MALKQLTTSLTRASKLASSGGHHYRLALPGSFRCFSDLDPSRMQQNYASSHGGLSFTSSSNSSSNSSSRSIGRRPHFVDRLSRPSTGPIETQMQRKQVLSCQTLPELFNLFEDNSFTSRADVSVYTAAMKKCNSDFKNTSACVKLSHLARTRGVQLNAFYYSVLFDALSNNPKEGLAENILRYLDEMDQLKVEPNIVLVNTLFKAVTKIRPHNKNYNYETSFETSEASGDDDMERFERTAPAENLLKRAHNYIEKFGLELDVICYGTLINLHASAVEPEQAEKVFNSMQERGVQPTKETYGAIMKAWSCAGDMKKAVSYYDEMVQKLGTSFAFKSSGSEPDFVSYLVLVKGFIRNGKPEEALKWFTKMEAECGGEAACVNKVTSLQKQVVYCKLLEQVRDEQNDEKMREYLDMIVNKIPEQLQRAGFFYHNYVERKALEILAEYVQQEEWNTLVPRVEAWMEKYKIPVGRMRQQDGMDTGVIDLDVRRVSTALGVFCFRRAMVRNLNVLNHLVASNGSLCVITGFGPIGAAIVRELESYGVLVEKRENQGAIMLAPEHLEGVVNAVKSMGNEQFMNIVNDACD